MPRHAVRRALSAVVALLTALPLALLTPVSPAAAEPVPSASDVEQSRRAVSSRAEQVGRIEAQLAAATARTAQLANDVAQAVEAYNGARYRLEQAVTEAAVAARNAEAGRARVEAAREQLGRFAAAAYRSGGDLSGLSVFLSADGPRELLDRASAIDAIGAHRSRALAGLRSAEVAARVLEVRARELVAEREDAAAAVEQAKVAAEQTLAGQQRAAASIAAQRRSLLVELAAARDTSVRLERARQAGLARARAARAERERRQAARRAAADRDDDRAARPAGRPGGSGGSASGGGTGSAGGSGGGSGASGGGSGGSGPGGSGGTGGSGGAGDGGTATSGGSSSGTASGASAAIAYARNQIGKPYRWAASGPDAFDCSGLTMRAWQRGGVSLPHYSVAQYEQGRKVPLGELRRGDLVFFGSDKGNPASIYHVGLYIGGGQMIEAPFTGEDVRVASIYRDSLFGAARP